MASSSDRENVVYVAKLAEQAERFDEMVEKMKDVAKMGVELTASERNLLSIGYKNVTGYRRASWRVLSAVEQTEGNEANVKRINEYREKVAKEISDICTDILSIIDHYLLPSTSNPDATVFFHKMKGDHYRYLAEIKTGTDRKEAADKSLNSYEAATLTAETELMPAEPIRLGLALNLSVLHNLILNSPERALHIAKQAFDEAISGLDSLGEEALKNSTLTLHLLQDNIKLWSSELSEDAEVNVGNTTSLIFD